MKTTAKVSLCCLFLFALGLRIGVTLKLEPKIYFDDAVYHDRIADNILAGKGAIASKNSVAMRMPLYPYFLSWCKSVSPDTPSYILLVRFLQAGLNAMLVFVLFMLAKYLLGPGYGFLAMALFALNPMHVVMPSFLLTEIVYTFFLTVFVWATVFYLDKKNWIYFVISALALIGGIYVRESMFHIIVVYCSFALLMRLLRGSRAFFLTLLVIGMLALCPWVLRNFERLHAFVLFTTQTGWTLYDAVNPKADGGTDVSRFRFDDAPMNVSELEDDRHWKEKAFQAIRHDPLRIASLATKKLRKFWNVVPNSAEFKEKGLPIIFGLYYVPVLFLFLLGVISLRWVSDRAFLVIFIPIIYAILLHTIINGSLRYRMPLEPLIIIIALSGLKNV